MEKPNNPPAFSRPYSGTNAYEQEGMSLRDYFAAKVMQATLSNVELRIVAQKAGKELGLTVTQATAKDAYEFADAMLAERVKVLNGEKE